MTSIALARAAPAFNADFYATFATVIPVLFLALAVQGQLYSQLLGTVTKAAGNIVLVWTGASKVLRNPASALRGLLHLSGPASPEAARRHAPTRAWPLVGPISKGLRSAFQQLRPDFGQALAALAAGSLALLLALSIVVLCAAGEVEAIIALSAQSAAPGGKILVLLSTYFLLAAVAGQPIGLLITSGRKVVAAAKAASEQNSAGGTDQSEAVDAAAPPQEPGPAPGPATPA